MLSDSCFQLVNDILDAVVDYDYSDDYKNNILRVIMELNEIKDDLDRCGVGNLLKDNKKESRQIARKMFKNAQKKRDCNSVDYWDDVY